MRAVGVLVSLPLVVGSATAIGCELPAVPLGWVAGGTFLTALVSFGCARPRACAVGLVAACLAAGGALGADARRRALEPSLRAVLDRVIGGVAIDTPGPEGDHDPLPLRGRLIEDAAVADDFTSLQVTATALFVDGAWVPVDGGLRLSVSGTHGRDLAGEWRAGRTIEAPVTFRRPARYLNPGVADAERDLALSGTALAGSIKSALLVDVVAAGPAAAEWAGRVRARVRQSVERWVSLHDPLAGAIVTAVLIGDRTGLRDDVRDRLQAAGTYHVIAISGGNIAILAGLAVGALIVAGVRGRAAALGTAGVLLVYAYIVAAGPSVWRATTMAVLYLGARGLDHRTPPWQAMAVAAGLMTVIDPLGVRDAGFVLTFGATGALIEGVRRWRRAAWLVAPLAGSLAVELALMPVSARLFARVTGAGIVLNLLAVPLMAVAQVAGMTVVALDALGLPAAAAGWLAAAAASAIVGSAGLVDVAPWLASRVPPPGSWLLAAYYVSLGAAWLGGARVRPAAGVATAVIAVIIATGWTPPPAPPDRLRLTLLDVGQAEAMLLELPGGPRLLVDSGGLPFGDRFDVGGRVIAPALWARGLRRLDGLLITHGDPDHVGGAAVIADIFRPPWLYEGIVVPGHEPTTLLRQRAAAAGRRVERLRAGRELVFGASRLRVLHPPEPDWERPRVRNDDSVVIEVVYRDAAILLTGDISAGVERAIVPSLTPARHRILKVAHHGSRTSTSPALLDAWRPQLALISAGRGNSFGHPTPEILDRLAAIGARVLRTDRQGQVAVETDGYAVEVTSYVEGVK